MIIGMSRFRFYGSVAHALRGLASACVFCALLLAAGLAQAQAPAPTSAGPAAEQSEAARDLSIAELEALVATLENDAERTAFLARLKGLIAASREMEQAQPTASLGGQMLDAVSSALGAASGPLADLVVQTEEVPGLIAWMSDWVGEPRTREAVLDGAMRIGIVLAAALTAFWLARRIIALPLGRLSNVAEPVSWPRRILLGIGRGVLETLAPVALVAAACLSMTLVEPDSRVRLATVALVTGFAAWQMVMVAADVVLAPNADRLRWLRVGDETAAYMTLWTRRLAMIGILGWFGAETASAFGMPPGGHALLVHVVGFILATLSVILVLQNRQSVAAWMVGTQAPPPDFDAAGDQAGLFGDEDPGAAARPASAAETVRGAKAWLGGSNQELGPILRRRLADIWHVLAAAYIAAAFLVWVLGVEGGFTFLIRSTVLSVVVVGVALIALALEARGLERLFHIAPETEARFPGLRRRANRYVPLMHGLIRSILLIASVAAILEIWGVGIVAGLSSGTGRQLLEGLVSIVLVLMVGAGAWELSSSAIERYLSAQDQQGRAVQRSARVKTLLPLVRTVIAVLITIVVALIVLSELGINIAPLLAGAGVIGLAIGFGSQKLVQDIINGGFILVEDAISVGDVVDLGGHSGVVEAITVRSIRLRDVSGTVHVIPFSAVDRVSNLTKDFSYYVLDMGVAYREDTDEVCAVMKEVLEDLRADPNFGPFILEPLEVLGVDAFADSAVIIKARIKTLPIKQWMVGREYNRRVKKRFDALGIEIPFPHQTIYFGEDKKGMSPSARVLLQRAEAAEADVKAPTRKPRRKAAKPKAPDAEASALASLSTE